MEYVFRYNQSSTDMRVAELKKSFTQQGYQALDFNDQSSVQKGIYYLEPRVTVDEKFWRTVIQGSLVFGYQPTIDNVPAGVTYVSLNEDADFIKANNQLTAKAFRQIVDKSYQGKNKKILICGYGKLTTALEEVFHDWKIAILNFNWHKMPELKKKYGNSAYFKRRTISKFFHYCQYDSVQFDSSVKLGTRTEQAKNLRFSVSTIWF